MKIIYKAILPLCLGISLSSCSNLPENSATISTEVMKTAIVQVSTMVVETQTAFSTNTAIASPIPTFGLPTFTVTPVVSSPDGLVRPVPEARLDYAMAIAPKVYNRLPFIGEASPYGEYGGCADTNDFSNVVYYGISQPLETVTSAFKDYFLQDKWGFTQATTELVGDAIKVPQVSYDVYRILPNEPSALERLQIVLRDESSFREKDYIDVRVVLRHIETKSSFRYFGELDCGINNRWLWIHLVKE